MIVREIQALRARDLISGFPLFFRVSIISKIIIMSIVNPGWVQMVSMVTAIICVIIMDAKFTPPVFVFAYLEQIS